MRNAYRILFKKRGRRLFGRRRPRWRDNKVANERTMEGANDGHSFWCGSSYGLSHFMCCYCSKVMGALYRHHFLKKLLNRRSSIVILKLSTNFMKITVISSAGTTKHLPCYVFHDLCFVCFGVRFVACNCVIAV